MSLLNKKMKSLLKMASAIGCSVCGLLALTYYIHVSDADMLMRNPQIYMQRSMSVCFKPKETEVFDDPQTLKLCRAIKQGNIKKIKRLIDSGADVNAMGSDGRSLLYWALPAGEEVFELLLSSGADPNSMRQNYDKENTQNKGNLPHGNAGGVNLVTETLGSITIGESFFRNYPSLLLKYGADPNIGMVSPLSVAASSSLTRGYFYKLIDAGADVNPAYGFPVVDWLGQGDKSIYLLEHGAIYDVNTPQGVALQNRIYELTEPRSGQFTPMSPESRESVEKTRKWLEAHGVSFDKRAPRVK